MKLSLSLSAMMPWQLCLQAAVLAARLLLQQDRSDPLKSSCHVAVGSPPRSHPTSTLTQTGVAPVPSPARSVTMDWCLQGARCAVAPAADTAARLRTQ